MEYMELILDFIYTNDTKAIQAGLYSDNYLYNMIVICDQYFIESLRNIFELIIVDRITIKKCAEILEFAIDYNCKILRKVCKDFIILNMARFIDQHALEMLDYSILEEIDGHYKCNQEDSEQDDMEKDVYNEMFEYADVIRESFTDNYQVDLYYKKDNAMYSRPTSKEKKVRTTSTNQQERRNYEKEAINKEISSIKKNATDKKYTDALSPNMSEAQMISEELLTKAKQWTKVTDKKDVKKKIAVTGLQSNDIPTSELKEKEMFVSLNKLNLESSPVSIKNTSTDMVEAIPLRSQISLTDFIPQLNRKLSLKQRKSQALNKSFELPTQIVENDVLNVSAPAPIIPNVWTMMSPKETNPNTTTQINIPSVKTASSNHFPDLSNSFKSSSAFALSTSPDASSSNNFTNIIKNEKKEKEYFEKLKTKSLYLTQMEEAAIAELKRFYNIDNVHDERITVDRTPHIQPTTNYAVWYA